MTRRRSNLGGLFDDNDYEEVPDVGTKSLLSREAKNLMSNKRPKKVSEIDRFGEEVIVEVNELKFVEGGHTIWVNGSGGNVLRIKTMDGYVVTSKECETSPSSHADILVEGNIEICIGKGERSMKLKKAKLERRLGYLKQNGFHVEDKRKSKKTEKPLVSEVLYGEPTTGRLSSSGKSSIANAPRVERMTTRDYILQVLRDAEDGDRQTVNRIHVEVLAMPGNPDVSLNAIKKSLKRLKDNHEVIEENGTYRI